MKNNKAHEVFSHLSRNDISFNHNPEMPAVDNDTSLNVYYMTRCVKYNWEF